MGNRINSTLTTASHHLQSNKIYNQQFIFYDTAMTVETDGRRGTCPVRKPTTPGVRRLPACGHERVPAREKQRNGSDGDDESRGMERLASPDEGSASDPKVG